MLLLAVETSCDETSVAVLRDGSVLANAVSSQVKLHEEYGGVVPELASREHLRNLMPVARQALGQANVTPQQLDAVAATRGPGLPGALLVGLRAAQGMALPWQSRSLGFTITRRIFIHRGLVAIRFRFSWNLLNLTFR